MKFDEILGKLGEFGTFQKRIYFLLGLPSISIGSFCVMVIVVLYTPKHRCKIPGLDNDTYALQDSIHKDLINQTIPLSSDPTLTYDQCHLYKYGYDAESQNTTVSMVQCTDWVYDQTVFYDTFTSKANLVCGEAMKTAHIQMLFYFGVLLGDFILGTVADLTGRKKALILGFVIVLIASVSVTFVRGFIGFSILQLIVGGAAHGAFIVIAVITLEIVGLSHRVWTGMWLQIFFAIGVCYVAVMAYLIRSWMWINLSCAMPCVLYLAYWWCIPESPRWLISKGRQAESATIIQRAAKQNKVTLSLEAYAEVKEESKGKDGRIWHVFMSPILCRRTLILFLNWTVISMTYFGVQMNAENLGGDYYLNFLLMGIAEFPGYAVGILLTDRLGRRPSHVGAMCFGGVACISSLFVVISGRNDLQPLTIALAFIGKAGASAAFGIVYIFTAELLPTVVRNAGMGVCSCAARVGAMLAPYIAKSGELIGGNFGKVFPLVVFGALSILAGLLVLFLPETLKQKLPDTIEEGENFGRNKNQVDEKEVEVPFISESKLA